MIGCYIYTIKIAYRESFHWNWIRRTKQIQHKPMPTLDIDKTSWNWPFHILCCRPLRVPLALEMAMGEVFATGDRRKPLGTQRKIECNMCPTSQLSSMWLLCPTTIPHWHRQIMHSLSHCYYEVGCRSAHAIITQSPDNNVVVKPNVIQRIIIIIIEQLSLTMLRSLSSKICMCMLFIWPPMCFVGPTVRMYEFIYMYIYSRTCWNVVGLIRLWWRQTRIHVAFIPSPIRHTRFATHTFCVYYTNTGTDSTDSTRNSTDKHMRLSCRPRRRRGRRHLEQFALFPTISRGFVAGSCMLACVDHVANFCTEMFVHCQPAHKHTNTHTHVTMRHGTARLPDAGYVMPLPLRS